MQATAAANASQLATKIESAVSSASSTGTITGLRARPENLRQFCASRHQCAVTLPLQRCGFVLGGDYVRTDCDCVRAVLAA